LWRHASSDRTRLEQWRWHPHPMRRLRLLSISEIDLAQSINPEKKVAWERARQAASAVGLAQSEYFPILALPNTATARASA